MENGEIRFFWKKCVTRIYRRMTWRLLKATLDPRGDVRSVPNPAVALTLHGSLLLCVDWVSSPLGTQYPAFHRVTVQGLVSVRGFPRWEARKRSAQTGQEKRQ